MEENYQTQDQKQITVEDIDQIVQKVEKRAQSRPVYRFGVLALAVGIGSYYGVGRHVVKINKDLKALRKNVAAIGEFMVSDSQLREFKDAKNYQSLFDMYFGPRNS